MTVLISPDGGGEFTVIDEFACLGERFFSGLRHDRVWHGHDREPKPGGTEIAVTIEIKFR